MPNLVNNEQLKGIKSIYFESKAVPLNATVPEELKEWAQKKATQNNMTLSKYISSVLFDCWLESDNNKDENSI